MTKKWFKLDNAAKIYPAFASQKDPATFRVSVILNETINPNMLQKALDEILPKFPSMAVTLKNGLFWYYLDENTRPAKIKVETKLPCSYIRPNRNQGYLFQIFYYRKRISLECFHGLTDGYGATEFLKSLLYHYIKQNHIIKPDLLEFSGDKPKHFEDSYKKYANDKYIDGNTVPAKHIKGKAINMDGAYLHHCIINAEDIKKSAKEYNTSITIMITALYLKSIASVIDEYPIVVTVPANLRKMFPSETLRNFSYIINIICTEDRPLDQMIDIVSTQFKKQLDKDNLQGQFSKNVNFENITALKLIPNVVKNIFLKQVRKFNSKNVVTSIFSNPGVISLPKSMIPHIKYFEFALYASDPHSINMGMVTFNNKMVITLSRSIEEKEIIDNFFGLLKTELGLNIELYSNKD